MEKFTPTGHMMLVKPVSSENGSTESGLQLVNLTTRKVEVVEVPAIEPYASTYKKGDILLLSENAGHHQYYNNEQCLWVNSKGFPDGDIWCIITETDK